MGIKCCVCEMQICKYELDFEACGGIWINPIGKPICNVCAKIIAKQLIEDA